jgi:flagellum-specific peptidoglycan hydrolase FlgJ
MPIIVPIEENKVGLATATDAKFRAPDYSGSGLEALGAGLVQLGGGGQQLASGIEERRRRAAEAIAAAMLDDKHQSNIDDAAVKNAYVDYSDLTHEALNGDKGLFKQQGADAHAAFPGVVEKLVDNHDKSLSKLDDVQRAAVAPSMNERLRSDVERAAEHVRQQGTAEQKWQSEQLQKAAARDAANHADDPDLFDHHIATGENSIRQQAKIGNVGDKLLIKQIGDYKSAAHADTIEALAQRDPMHAAGWYARYGGDLNGRDKMRVESTLGPALVDARAVADVDAASSAGDPTAAPANPHVGNDATLLLKMQGITPMMDQTALPALMQRYGHDPAKVWAAFEAGPETVDRLITQRGDDWYARVGDDTRRFVDGNMNMLGGAHSPRDVPADPQGVAAWIASQPWEGPRKSAAVRELDQRVRQYGAANMGSIVPASLMRFDGSQPPVSATSEDPTQDDNVGEMKVFPLRPNTKAKPLTQKERNFFDINYEAASRVAKEYHVDVSLLLGLAALESDWGHSPMARKQKNPYGATPHAKAGVTYDSIDRAWQRWGEEHGARVTGVGSDADQFTTRLRIDNRARVGAVDRLGSYNSESPGWKAGVMTRINQVRAKIGMWEAASRR